jgi:hypothetical protein
MAIKLRRTAGAAARGADLVDEGDEVDHGVVLDVLRGELGLSAEYIYIYICTCIYIYMLMYIYI